MPVNPRITEKIKELIGEDAPDSLMYFFNEILKTEEKNELTNALEGKELQSAYQNSVDKYSQDKKIIAFLESKQTNGDNN